MKDFTLKMHNGRTNDTIFCNQLRRDLNQALSFDIGTAVGLSAALDQIFSELGFYSIEHGVRKTGRLKERPTLLSRAEAVRLVVHMTSFILPPERALELTLLLYYANSKVGFVENLLAAGKWSLAGRSESNWHKYSSFFLQDMLYALSGGSLQLETSALRGIMAAILENAPEGTPARLEPVELLNLCRLSVRLIQYGFGMIVEEMPTNNLDFSKPVGDKKYPASNAPSTWQMETELMDLLSVCYPNTKSPYDIEELFGEEK